MAGTSATARDADAQSGRADDKRSGASSTGAMALQSSRSYDAAPQMFVRLTGSHLAKPRLQRLVTA